MRVSKLLAGGAAADNGRIHINDHLHTVDGVDVRRLALKTIAEKHIRGTKGSWVELTLQSQSSADVYTVRLQRM